MTPTPRTITRAQYLQLVGLQTLAEHHRQISDSLIKAAVDITREVDHKGERETGGHTCNIVWGSRPLDEGLRLMGITVEGQV